MDDEGNIKLPESTTPTTKPESGVGGGGGEVDAWYHLCKVDNTILISLKTITAFLALLPKG